MYIYIIFVYVCIYLYIYIYVCVFLYMHRYVLSHGCWHCFFRINTWDEKNISLSSFNHQRYWEATSRWIYPLSMASASLSLQVELNSPTTFCFLGSLYIYVYICIYIYIHINLYTYILSGWLKLCDFLAGYVDWMKIAEGFGVSCHQV